ANAQRSTGHHVFGPGDYGAVHSGGADPVELAGGMWCLGEVDRMIVGLRGRIRRGDGGSRCGRICVGLSHAIFVSLVDGGGFNSVRERDWLPPDNDDDDDDDCISGAGGPVAELYAAGFDWHDNDDDGAVASATMTRITAMVSVSSEPVVVHRALLSLCRRVYVPVDGSGGTSLGRPAPLRRRRAPWQKVGRGRTAAADSSTPAEDDGDYNGDEPVTAVTTPRLRSILEAALPAFLFVCIALRLANAWEGGDDDAPCNFCLSNHDKNGTTTAISTMVHTL
ncbi:hypothetical protein ACHAW5_001273, partial [Stephanodiscus triporus]